VLLFIGNAANYILVILDNSLVYRGRYQMLHQYSSASDDEHIMLETCRGL